MRKIIFILILALLAADAFALDKEVFNIQVTINQPPGVEEVLPKDGYVITEGSTLNIIVTANDPNSQDMLQYQYYINGQVKKDWTQDSTFNYILGDGDIGLNKIKVKVTDGLETVEMAESEIYVFRGSPNMPED